MEAISLVKYLISREPVLDFKEIEEIPEETNVYQTEDGILFFHETSAPSRLYVKWEGKVFNSNFAFCSADVHRNALYFFAADEKLYTAVFSPSKGITVSFLRNKLEGEAVITNYFRRGGICRIMRDGKQFFYRMCDDPRKGGVTVDHVDHELTLLDVLGIHRGKLIFTDDGYWPRAKRLSDNAILFNFPMQFEVITACTYSQDSSPFFYTSDIDKITVLNTERMSILPCLKPPEDMGIRIAGVHKGILTAVATRGTRCPVILAARLPKGYYKVTDENEEDGLTIIEKQFGDSMPATL